MSPTFVSLVLLCQKLPKSLLCHAHCSRIKSLSAILWLPWPFVLAIPWYQFSTNSRSIYSLNDLMLDDEGCFNAFLPMDLFLSTARHLALGMIFRVLWQYLGDCNHQWQFPLLLGSGNTLMSPTLWILQVFDFKSLYSHLLECTRYLGDHFHKWWFPSHLLTVLIIDR